MKKLVSKYIKQTLVHQSLQFLHMETLQKLYVPGEQVQEEQRESLISHFSLGFHILNNSQSSAGVIEICVRQYNNRHKWQLF